MITESRTVTPVALTPADVTEPAVDMPAQIDPVESLQRQVHDLVRARVLESIGSGGNWTVEFRRTGDGDTFFSETMADMIAWDVAARLAPPTVPNRARLS